VLTDGEDTASKATLMNAVAATQLAGAPVFTVGLGANLDRDVLNTLAAETGGVALYAPSSTDLQTAFKNIADQLRNQYVLTVTSGLPADGRRHTLFVRARAAGGQAEAKGTFVATAVPPEITIVSPTAGQLVQGVVRVEVKATAAGRVSKVEAIAAGRVVGSTEREPYVFEWDTSRLASGNHTLAVAVYDALGNRGIKEVAVRVEGAPVPTPVPEPTPTPVPPPPPPRGGPDPVLLYGGGVLVLVALGLVIASRRQRGPQPPYMKYVRPKEKRPSKCPDCGGPLRQGICAKCTAEDNESIRRRLYELAGRDPDDAGKREGQP
jgi:hypothetical protein